MQVDLLLQQDNLVRHHYPTASVAFVLAVAVVVVMAVVVVVVVMAVVMVVAAVLVHRNLTHRLLDDSSCLERCGGNDGVGCSVPARSVVD